MSNLNEPILEVSNLTKHFSQFALKGVSFSLPHGYIMGFIGPNGAGKSTTIKLILNLMHKDGGEIEVFGLDHNQRQLEIRNRIGFVYDECHFYQELTIAQTARFVAAHYLNWNEKRFQHYLKLFNVSPKLQIKELSKGMKMKFSLAIALSHKAELLIMDEPTSGLDPIVRLELLEILADLIQDEKCSVFFSTHITSDLDKIADYITFIQNGEIIFTESKEEVLERYFMVKGKSELLTPPLRESLIGIKETQFGFEALSSNNPTSLPRELREQFIFEKPTLEDIMIHTVRGK